jgi:uncharacterized membrane protein YdjX (TVP38/TMEM64 family)
MAPIGGDALTFIAGVMRVRFDPFFVLTVLGKGARYAIVLGLVEGFGAAVGSDRAAEGGAGSLRITFPSVDRDQKSSSNSGSIDL